MCVHILSLVLKHFSATLQQLSPSMRLTKVLAKEKLSGFLGKTLQKLCLRGTLENLKHALSLISRRCPKQKVGRKLSNKNWKRTKRFYPLSHNFNRHCTKLEKHTYGQMAFNTKPAVAQRDIQGASLDLL